MALSCAQEVQICMLLHQNDQAPELLAVYALYASMCLQWYSKHELLADNVNLKTIVNFLAKTECYMGQKMAFKWLKCLAFCRISCDVASCGSQNKSAKVFYFIFLFFLAVLMWICAFYSCAKMHINALV